MRSYGTARATSDDTSGNDTQSLADIKSEKDRALLNRLALEDRAYAAEIDLNKALRKKLRPKIEALLAKLKVKRAIKAEQWHAILMPGKSQLSAELLVQNGVDVDIINASKKKGESTWQIRGVKETKEEDDD